LDRGTRHHADVGPWNTEREHAQFDADDEQAQQNGRTYVEAKRNDQDGGENEKAQPAVPNRWSRGKDSRKEQAEDLPAALGRQ